METVFFVYMLTFANGKVYVGMSRLDAKGRSTNRYRQHANAAKKGELNPIYHAWRKHGAPLQTILSTHSTRDACALAEIDAIQSYDSMNPEKGYNPQPGGQGLHAPVGSAVYELMRAKVWDHPERRRKASEALKGKPLPESVLTAHRVWRESDAGKAMTREITSRPEVRARLSTAMSRRLDDGYREYLSAVQIGKPRTVSPEGRARGSAARKAWLATEEGKAASRKGLTNMRANPENEAKRKAAHAEYAASAANLAHCATMGAAARKPVKDLSTGQVFESRTAAAAAHGVSGPTIGYWIKRGKFAYC
jgi:hypothetical protein